MQTEQNCKIYFIPGDLVTIKHFLENKPIMLVTEVVTNSIYRHTTFSKPPTEKTNMFKGIRCGWFDKRQVWRELIFSTKDLIKVEEGE